MEYNDYQEAMGNVQSLREDVRFNRDLNLSSIFRNARIITDTITKENNLLKIMKRVNHEGDYEFTHPVNVAIIASMIAKWLDMQSNEINELACAGLLHDLGKAKVRDSLLTKKTELTEAEFELLRSHPLKGFEYLLEEDDLSGACKMAVLSHHERHDGSGYPYKIKGDNIHLYAKIIAVADIFDAMTSDRIYSSKKTIMLAAKEIVNGSFGLLDPHISQLFFKRLCECCLGSKVILSNDEVGEIVYVSQLHPYEPLVRCQKGYYDLVKQKDIKIIDIL
jgi:HD-GYP domain-containing protein (c-di-GMP phosphodiesterase class II)